MDINSSINIQETDDILCELLYKNLDIEDKQQFIAHFKLYLVHGSDRTNFIINLDDVWKWIGFSRKDHAKRCVIKNLEENVDYVIKIFFPPNGENSKRGRPNEHMLLNVESFKALCMLANTDQGKQTRKYYSKMENIFFLYIQEKNKNIVETLMLKNKQEQEQQQHKLLRQAYKQRPCVYIAKVYDDDMIVKLGESDNIDDRIKSIKHEYNTDAILLHCIDCKTPHHYEQYLLNKQVEIASRRMQKTEFIQLDDYLTLSKIQDIVKRNVGPFEDKYSSSEGMKLQNQNKLSEERLFIYQRIHEAKSTEEKVEWEEKLQLTQNATIDSCVDEPLDTQSITHPYRRVYQYTPDNLSVPCAEHISLREAARSLPNKKFHDYHIREACVHNTIFEGYRWFIVDNGGMKPNTIPLTNTIPQKAVKRIGLVAQLNIKKDIILHVFASQKEAAVSVKVKPCSITFALTNNKLSGGSYWIMYEDCDQELKDTYKEELPNFQVPETCSQKVQQIDPLTSQVIETYSCLQDVCSKFTTSHKTIRKYSATGDIYKGYIWKLA